MMEVLLLLIYQSINSLKIIQVAWSERDQTGFRLISLTNPHLHTEQEVGMVWARPGRGTCLRSRRPGLFEGWFGWKLGCL